VCQLRGDLTRCTLESAMTRRAALLALVVAALAAAGLGHARSTEPSARCAATPVHYGDNGAFSFDRAAWIAAGTGRDRLTGFVHAHDDNLGDARVRTAAGYTIYAGRDNKIAWLPQSFEGVGRRLIVTARRLDGPGAIRWRFPRALSPRFFPSGLRLPTAGCWRVTLRSGRLRGTFDVRAVDPPATPRCDTNAVRTGRHPIDGTIAQWVDLTPRSEGISGTFSVSVPGTAGAAIYAGGRWPNGANTKVLWITRSLVGTLRVRATRLDAHGSFELSARAASTSTPGGFFPSIPVVPEPGGCALVVQSGPHGGVLVVRALTPS
jgi:hypothetical protein